MCHVGRQQAFHADAHVGQTPGRIDARTDGKAQVHGVEGWPCTARHLQQRGDARPCPAGADARQPGVDDDPIVAGQWHHVGHGTQRSQIEQR